MRAAPEPCSESNLSQSHLINPQGMVGISDGFEPGV